jgi:sugar (pentulose or hexulose) kinase
LILLGIDIGTTHVKACAYGEDGRLLHAARRPTPTRRLPGGGAEYDAEPLVEAARGAIREAVEKSGPPRAVGISSMAEAGFLLDANGNALYPAIAWFDGRTAPQAERWRERLSEEELFARTGLHITPLYSACKLEWLRENEPTVWSRARAWLGMSEYLAFRLTGEYGTDPSLAGRTMLYDIARGSWDGELCKLAGVPVDLMPPVRPSGTPIGRLSAEAARMLSVPEGVPVAVCGHDHICGAFGAGATSPGEISDSIGTAEAAVLTLERAPLDRAGYELEAPIGCHVLPERYYAAAALPVAGGLVDQLLNLLGGSEEDLAHWTEEAAALAPGEGGVCIPPTDYDPEAGGLLLSRLSPESRPGHLLRAVLEGLTLEINNALKRSLRAADTEPAGISVFGGGARSELWAKLKADASGLPVRVVADPECVARGAAMLAGVGAGIFPDADYVPSPEYKSAIEPSGERAVYERLYSEAHEPLRERMRCWIPLQKTY